MILPGRTFIPHFIGDSKELLRILSPYDILFVMNRRYFFPIIALVIAAIFYIFSDKFSNEDRKESVKNPAGNASIVVEEPSLVPDPSTVGTLEINISLTDRETPEKLNGSIELIRLNNDGAEELIKSVKAVAPMLSFRFLLPGKYRIEAEINIPDSDYNFIAKPASIEIIPGKTIRHEIVIP